MNKKVLIVLGILLVLGAGFYFFKNKTKPKEIGMPNPASVNCEEKGGKLTIAKMPSGGEYGICTFADNRQCEEWAFYRGECPTGGVKVTGYNTEAAKFCAIRGGQYTVTKAEEGSKPEEGICLLKNYASCDALKYFTDGCTGTVYFTCKDSKAISVSFKDKTAEIILSDGRYLNLPAALSASGARYANKDETQVFWNKGDTAFFEENGVETFSGCQVKAD